MPQERIVRVPFDAGSLDAERLAAGWRWSSTCLRADHDDRFTPWPPAALRRSACRGSRKRGAWPAHARRASAPGRRARGRAAAGLRPGQFARESTPVSAVKRTHAGIDHDQRHPGPCPGCTCRAYPGGRLRQLQCRVRTTAARGRVLFISSAPATRRRGPGRHAAGGGPGGVFCARTATVRLNDGARLAWDCFEHHGGVLEGALEWRGGARLCTLGYDDDVRAAARGRSVSPGPGSASRSAARGDRRVGIVKSYWPK